MNLPLPNTQQECRVQKSETMDDWRDTVGEAVAARREGAIVAVRRLESPKPGRRLRFRETLDDTLQM
jgi:hypothetical protein